MHQHLRGVSYVLHAEETYINICHIPKRDEKRCYNKEKYEKQDPMALLTSSAEKSFTERSKASGGSHNQQQAPRNARAD